MKKFRECMYPDGCKENSMTTRLNKHHIIPKQLGGKDVKQNFLHLCPNHHNKIYVEGSKGIHGSIIKGSVILKERLSSTVGDVLKYINCDDGLTYLYYYNTNEKIIYNEDNIK
jgi:hypothetical protein